MQIPMEILTLIASHLDAQSLGSFRLICRQCAGAGSSLVPQNGLCVLNTAGSLRTLKQLLESPVIAKNTKKITIVQGNWPVCSRQEWEIHPLLCHGNDCQLYPSKSADNAFAAYSSFIEEELACSDYDRVNNLRSVLQLLPNLHTVTVTNIQLWAWHPTWNVHFHKLIKRIWMGPLLKYEVTHALQTFLAAVGDGFQKVKNLSVNGDFTPTALDNIPSLFAGFQSLEIEAFRVSQNETAIQRFLQAFPNIKTLSMSFHGWGPSIASIFGQLFWPRLQLLYINDIWASENELFVIFENHSKTLTSFNIYNATLTQGSWRGLFTKIRSLNAQAMVTADGELYGRKREHTLNMENTTAILKLKHFMRDHNAAWPFDNAGLNI